MQTPKHDAASSAVPKSTGRPLATQAEIMASKVLSPYKAVRTAGVAPPAAGIVPSTPSSRLGDVARAAPRDAVRAAVSTDATLSTPTFAYLRDTLGSYIRDDGATAATGTSNSDLAQAAKIRRGLSSSTHAESREVLREMFSRYATPAKSSDAVSALRRAFNSSDFENQRRMLRAAFADLMPTDKSPSDDTAYGSSSKVIAQRNDDHAFSALLSSSSKAQALLRTG
jgi:hypothetical protein